MSDSEANPVRPPRIRVESEALLVVEFEPRIDERINARAIALAEAIRAASLQGVRDVVPTFRTVALHVDPLRVDWERVRSWIDANPATVSSAEANTEHELEVPVRYGGEDGPDLEDVARRCGLAPDEVARQHADAAYRVFMMGFVPGFAYLGMVPPTLRVPRLGRPRARVPAGSVAIADELTGVYPSDTPGGWHIIGRTDLQLFDASRAEPSLLRVGMGVRFRAVRAGVR